MDKPHDLFWRLPSDRFWKSEQFTSEQAARARLKTIIAKGSFWVLHCNGKLVDESKPKTL